MKRRFDKVRKPAARVLALLLSLLVVAGCGPGFTYQRKGNLTAAKGPRIARKVAVVAFEDATENFNRRGFLLSGYDFNLAKEGINGALIGTGAAFAVSALPAELWAKSFAEDLRALGIFQSVRLVLTPSELTDEDIVVDGALTKAYLTTIKNKPDEFALHLRARRAADRVVVWEQDVAKTGVRPAALTKGCLAGGCVVARIHGYLNGVMQEIFADAWRGLVQALAGHAPKEPTPSPADSPEDVIRRILEKS